MEQQAGRGWYDIGDGWAGLWDGTRWTGERISHEQLAALARSPAPPWPSRAPVPVAGPPKRGRWDGTSKERLPLIVAVVGALALVVIAGMVVTALKSPLERAAGDVDDECEVTQSDADRLAVTWSFQDLDCTEATLDLLDELGFVDGDLGAAMQGPVERGGYRIRSVDISTDARQQQLTITALD